MSFWIDTPSNSIQLIGSSLTVIIIALSVNVAHTAQVKDNLRSPFRVIWNIPDMACRVDFELSKYGILANNPRTFVGDQIATMYSSRIGLWPDFKGNNINYPVNGGIPQLSNLTAHLEQARKDVIRQIGENATGYGVIDQEIWHVQYHLNYGKLRVFRTASEDLVRKRDPNNRGPKLTAWKEWEASAKSMMLRTLEVAKAARPGVHWGYYLYPQTWPTISKTHFINNRLAWLYQASTGLYPSIYIRDSTTATHQVIEQRINDTLMEAIRVRAVHSRPNVPIIAYTSIHWGRNFFPKEILDYAIGQPAEMGIDGVIIWGSSGFFRPNPAETCNKIKQYVQDILGPFVSQLLNRLKNCSVTKCGGLGRCVRKDYAESVSNILAKIGGPKYRIDQSTGSSSPPLRDDYKNYVCLCYDDRTGPYCDKRKT